MKLIIDIPEEIKAVIDKNGTNEIVAETLWQAVKNGTPIPDNATDVLERIRGEIERLYTVDTVYEDVVAVDKTDVLKIIDKYR